MTGVIYGVIVALWAAVLIPVLVKRHDSRRIDHSKAMESLRHLTDPEVGPDPRRGGVQVPRGGVQPRRGGVVEVTPRRSRRDRAIEIAVTARPVTARPVTAPAAPDAPVRTTPPVTTRRAAAQAASRRAARRRRTILLLLVLVTAGVVAAGVLGYLPIWAGAIPGGLLIGFLMLALIAATSRRRARATSRRRAQRERGRARATRGRAEVRPAPAYRAADDGELDEDADLLEDDTWEPVPTTLPTYLTAGDDASATDWTAREMLEQAEVARARQSERQSERRVARAAELAALHRAAEEFFEPVQERSDRRAVGD